MSHASAQPKHTAEAMLPSLRFLSAEAQSAGLDGVQSLLNTAITEIITQSSPATPTGFSEDPDSNVVVFESRDSKARGLQLCILQLIREAERLGLDIACLNLDAAARSIDLDLRQG